MKREIGHIIITAFQKSKSFPFSHYLSYLVNYGVGYILRGWELLLKDAPAQEVVFTQTSAKPWVVDAISNVSHQAGGWRLRIHNKHVLNSDTVTSTMPSFTYLSLPIVS